MANRKDRTRTKSIKPAAAPYQLRRDPEPAPVLVAEPLLVAEPVLVAEPLLVAEPVLASEPVPVPVPVPVPDPVLISEPLPLPLPPPLPSLDLLRLPTPDEISLDLTAPDLPFPPPGLVPAGDSRSLRRATEFALIYRHHTHVISRTGDLGTHGRWHVTAYPTPAAASHAYALHAAYLVDDGFTDYVPAL